MYSESDFHPWPVSVGKKGGLKMCMNKAGLESLRHCSEILSCCSARVLYMQQRTRIKKFLLADCSLDLSCSE